MEWLKRRKRDQRGLEIQHLVPEMLRYVSERYKPVEQYCIGPFASPERIKYSLPVSAGDVKPDLPPTPPISTEEKDESELNPSPAAQEYPAWEKKNSEYKSFSSEVMRMVNEKYRKASDFYHAAGMDKRTFHKIRSDYGYVPSRTTAFRCCIGLKLTAEEAEDLLKLAGMAFSPSDPNDLVVKFCLENGIHDIPGINYMLHRYATRTLDKDKD